MNKTGRRLICTEVLHFGVYPTEGNRWSAIICGDGLGPEYFEAARVSFKKHGGAKKNELAPPIQTHVGDSHQQKPEKAPAVDFVREEVVDRMGEKMTYRFFKAPEDEIAKQFLAQQQVPPQFVYLVVETPNGNYCRDTVGMYKE